MLARLCAGCQQSYDPDSVPRNNRSWCASCLREYAREKRQRRGKTAARGYGAVWQGMAKAQIRRSPVCASCGAGEDLTVDHIVPLLRGGSSDPSNLQTLCRTCNGIKSGRIERAAEQARPRFSRNELLG
jgi:5-methylcytosine-specific restriction endonuclease McrA